MELKQVAILSLILIAYLCAGAAMFREIEGKKEKVVWDKLHQMFADFLGIINKVILFPFMLFA